MSYPEHEKLRSIMDEAGPIGQFLEWLDTQSIELCRRDDKWINQPFEAITERREALLARYFDIDLAKIEDEKRAMLAELREAGGL